MVRRCTYPSIHFFVSRSRSVVDCARVQAFVCVVCDMCGVRVVCVRVCVCVCVVCCACVLKWLCVCVESECGVCAESVLCCVVMCDVGAGVGVQNVWCLVCGVCVLCVLCFVCVWRGLARGKTRCVNKSVAKTPVDKERD